MIILYFVKIINCIHWAKNIDNIQFLFWPYEISKMWNVYNNITQYIVMFTISLYSV